MIYQLPNPIDVATPLGDATAIIIIDYGVDVNSVWLCRMPGGEVKHFYSDDVRVYANPMGGKGFDVERPDGWANPPAPEGLYKRATELSGVRKVHNIPDPQPTNNTTSANLEVIKKLESGLADVSKVFSLRLDVRGDTISIGDKMKAVVYAKTSQAGPCIYLYGKLNGDDSYEKICKVFDLAPPDFVPDFAFQIAYGVEIFYTRRLMNFITGYLLSNGIAASILDDNSIQKDGGFSIYPRVEKDRVHLRVRKQGIIIEEILFDNYNNVAYKLVKLLGQPDPQPTRTASDISDISLAVLAKYLEPFADAFGVDVELNEPCIYIDWPLFKVEYDESGFVFYKRRISEYVYDKCFTAGDKEMVLKFLEDNYRDSKSFYMAAVYKQVKKLLGASNIKAKYSMHTTSNIMYINGWEVSYTTNDLGRKCIKVEKQNTFSFLLTNNPKADAGWIVSKTTSNIKQ